jgi:hypothetical protein
MQIAGWPSFGESNLNTDPPSDLRKLKTPTEPIVAVSGAGMGRWVPEVVHRCCGVY